MNKIQMVDLQRQYQRYKKEIDSAIAEVIETAAFIKGPSVKEFENNFAKYLGVKHVIGCANGTDALQIALMALDLKPGDEIITSSFTFIATAEVGALMGLKSVFVDVAPDTFIITPENIEKAITPNTKVIVPVHLYGQSADMEKIMALAEKYNLYVVEDTAQASGADFIYCNGAKRKAGTIGHIGTTSFFPSKNLGCFGDGGALITNDDALAKKMHSIANHGMKVKYHHEAIGINSRLDTIQAAVLNVKLKYLDEFNSLRRKAADYYDNAFKNHAKIKTPVRSNCSTHIFHQYTLTLTNIDRANLQQKLSEAGIPSMIYYPVPLHLQKVFESSGYKLGDLPITEQLTLSVLSLPMHPELDEEQLKYITEKVLQFIENLN